MAKLTKPLIAVNIDGTVRVLNQDPNVTHFNWYTRELLSYNITSPNYDTIVAGTNESKTALPNSSYTNRVYITESYRDIRKFTSFNLYEAGETSGTSAVDVTELYVTKVSDFEYSISIPNVEHDYIITWGVGVITEPILFEGETSDFTLKATNKSWNGTVEYSTDKNTWSTWDGSEITSANKKLYLRGKNNTTFYSKKGAQFVLSAKAGCYGNINTLLDYENPPTTIAKSYCYLSMFQGCTSLTAAPALPATTLADSCYSSMFYGCTSLITAPELPATTLAGSCYESMFQGCTSLTEAPALPATTLEIGCYMRMFRGCTSLTAAPELPATTLADSCYQSMFQGCTSLTATPALPVTTLASSCYMGMFYGCTSLTAAPALPATTLKNGCYAEMFQDCTSLAEAPALPATTLEFYCYQRMFQGCRRIKISATQTGEYTTAWRIPSTGEIAAESYSWNNDMLKNTGGTFRANPSINTIYYGAW